MVDTLVLGASHLKVQLLFSVMRKKLIQLALTKRDIYEIYQPKPYRKTLTAFQTQFYKTQAIRNYYNISSRYIGKSILQTVILLEKRLDIIIVRMNLAFTINESRQKISHGKVYVNNIQVRSNNYKIKEGDLIEIKGTNVISNEVTKLMTCIINIPKNMMVNYKIKSGIYIREANIREIGIPIKI